MSFTSNAVSSKLPAPSLPPDVIPGIGLSSVEHTIIIISSVFLLLMLGFGSLQVYMISTLRKIGWDDCK